MFRRRSTTSAAITQTGESHFLREACYVRCMPKKTPDEKLPKAKADKARDAALSNMLRTPPKLHKNEPQRATVKRKRK